MVGAVADQNNFLVDYHWSRQGLERPRPDAAGCLVLRKGQAGVAKLRSLSLSYDGEPGRAHHWGPVELIHDLAGAVSRHQAHTLDGYHLSSEWEWV